MQAQPTALRSLGLHGINCIDGIAVAHRYHSAHYKSATSTRTDSTVTYHPKPRSAFLGLQLSSGYAAIQYIGYWLWVKDYT